jgi:hypothetical protein
MACTSTQKHGKPVQLLLTLPVPVPLCSPTCLPNAHSPHLLLLLLLLLERQQKC